MVDKMTLGKMFDFDGDGSTSDDEAAESLDFFSGLNQEDGNDDLNDEDVEEENDDVIDDNEENEQE